MKNRKKKGFTIVELVIVIAVIAILAAVLIPTFSNLVAKANLSSDSSLVKNINTQLAIAEQQDGKNKTMHDALLDAKEAGYLVSNINARSDNELVWDETIDRFALIDKEGNLVAGEISATKKVNLWKISNNVDNTYSTYYTGTSKVISTNKGFDSGEITDITSINYSNSGASQNVVIRTNSANTNLIVNAINDTVNHHGEVGALNIIAVNTSSYREYGIVGFAEIKVGRILLEPNSDVEHIHINSNGNNTFGNVVIKDNGTQNLPEAITRDEVNVNSATLVVTIESATGQQEEVYVYASGTTGTTEKTSTQNANVNSTLGGLVLDNGTDNKALSANEKAETKDEVASEAVSSEFANQEGNNNYVARIGQTGYTTLQAAVNAANASENAVTISILKDIQQSGSLIINNSVTINGGNHRFTTVGTATSGNMAAFDICDTQQKTPIVVNVKDLTINSTKHSRVFLLNADYCPYDNTNILNVNNLQITTDGQALYSNGPSTINADNCEIKHEGQYLSGKDAVYYSAIIVGYNGTLNIHNSKVSSFGNGAATFPSGGTVNIYNTEITAFDDFVDASTGYLFWARHEKSYDTGTYKDYCGSAIINVYSGVFEGPYKITHDGLTAANRIAAINIYGGSFEQDPSDYVQEGHTAQQNSNGTWIVS